MVQMLMLFGMDEQFYPILSGRDYWDNQAEITR